MRIQIIIFVLLLAGSMALKSVPSPLMDISVPDLDRLYHQFIDVCGPQQRKACFDSNKTLSCFHLSECDNVLMYSDYCESCIYGGYVWCGLDTSNRTGICTNDADLCTNTRTTSIYNSQDCPKLLTYSVFPLATIRELDCNFNNFNDEYEIYINGSVDSNGDGIIDTCEVDCNLNGQYDFFDIQFGNSTDLNDNHIPDDCEPDCNGNRIPDDLDIIYKYSSDRDKNGIPDECLTPSVTPSISPSSSVTPSLTPSPSPSSSITPSVSVTPSISVSITPSPSVENLDVVQDTASPSVSLLPSINPTIEIGTDIPFNETDTNTTSACDYCLNDGYCDESYGRCICEDNWIGKHCEISTCSYNGNYNFYTSSCSCFPGWGGEFCNVCIKYPSSVSNKIYLCCPSSKKVEQYNLILVDTMKADGFLNGLYSKSRCLFQNETFPNGDRLDCSCNFYEKPMDLSEEELAIRGSVGSDIKSSDIKKGYKSKVATFIFEKDSAVDMESYLAMALLDYQGLVEDNLNDRYPQELADAMVEKKTFFSEESSDDVETTSWIIFTVSIVIAVIIGVAVTMTFLYKTRDSVNDYKETMTEDKKIERKRTAKRISKKTNIV